MHVTASSYCWPNAGLFLAYSGLIVVQTQYQDQFELCLMPIKQCQITEEVSIVESSVKI